MNLCCDGFLSFFESLPSNITSEHELLTFISSELPALAKHIGLGKLEMTLCSKPIPFENESKSHCVVLYQYGLDLEEFSLCNTYQDREEAIVSYTVYPRKNHVWSEQEEKMLHFLTYQLFLLCSRTRLMERVQKASITDPLTGILNTAGFMKHGTILYENNKLTNYTGVFLNIKGFRYINQRFGFKQGDETMRKYTQRIRTLLQPDELFARLGCDNYALLIQNERIEDLLASLLSVRIPVQLEDFVHTFDFVSRAGLYPIRQGDTMNEVLNSMTVAGLLAKTSLHHNTIWFRDSMMERYIHDKEIADTFASAIENDEFSVYYQPKVMLDGQLLCGCEALARWDRIQEVIYPSEFVPILEREGTICILDFYVLENVCRDIRKWLDMGIEPIRISTNFSKIHLHNRNLAKDILNMLDCYHVDPKYIEIELTESCGYEDFDLLSEFVNTMKAHGIHTSIDDFGTGYSSLNLLKDLNIDTIKLDKSFLSRNQSNDQNTSETIVIKNIINMATDLHLQVVCEGVENIEQVTFLKSLHCPIAQGFFFDEPLSHDDFEKRLKSDRIYQKI